MERLPILLKITESLPKKSAVSPVYNSPPVKRWSREVDNQGENILNEVVLLMSYGAERHCQQSGRLVIRQVLAGKEY